MAQWRAVTSKCHPGETRALPSCVFFHSATSWPLSGRGCAFGVSAPPTSKRRAQWSHPRFATSSSEGWNIINDGHNAAECQRLSPLLKRHWWASQGFFDGTSGTGRWVDPGALTRLPHLYHLLRGSPSFPVCSNAHLGLAPPPENTPSPRSPWKTLHPSGGGFNSRSAVHPLYGRTSERADAPRQCHGLMLRDTSCLFKWQCCKDSRRQPYRQQDPPDYFVSDIKRSGYTQWERSRAGATSAATITLTRL